MSCLLLDCWPDGAHGYSLRAEEWQQIEKAIETVFRCGGSADLSEVEFLSDGVSVSPLQSIGMEGEPGRCRILVTPDYRPDRGHVRIWWDGGVPRGSEIFMYEDLTDRRSICEDVTVVKALFKEFFANKGVSPQIVSVTR